MVFCYGSPGKLIYTPIKRQRLSNWEENASSKCSCLDYHRDGGAWWAAVYGVAQSRTWVKQFSSSSSSSKPNSTATERIIHHNQVIFILGSQGWFAIWKLVNAIHYINRIKNSHHITIIRKTGTYLTKLNVHRKKGERKKTRERENRRNKELSVT